MGYRRRDKPRDEFIGYISFETARAIRFQDHFWDTEDWIPKSQCTVFRDPDTREVKVTMTDWICGKRGVREFQHWEGEDGQRD